MTGGTIDMGIPVEGYEDYIVEENGTVFSLKTNKNLKPHINPNGYATVELFNSNGSKRLLIHRLVAQAFIPNINNYNQVNHKDENKLNNCVDNLEWCTAKYNMNYGIGAKTRHLKIDYSTNKRKEIARQNGKKVSREVKQYDKNGNFIKKYESAKQASIETKCSHSHILECCHGKKYKTVGGFIWSF